MERARNERDTTFLAIEPNHAGLIEASSRARRDRVKNLHYLLGSYESLPGPLAGAADRVSVLFPWGSLLKAMAGGEACSLENLVAICKSGASVELVTAIDPAADAGELTRLGMPCFSPANIADAWRFAGFTEVEWRSLPAEHAYQTTWWRKIRQRAERQPVLLRAKAP